MSNPLVAIVYHSGYGHTAALAQAVARGAADGGARVLLLTSAEAAERLDELTAADAMIFGCPTYLGSVSAEFKVFMEKTAKIWFEQGWRDKLAAGFTNSGSLSGDKLAVLTQLSLFAAQHGMHWVNLGLLPGHSASNSPADGLNRLGVWLGAAAFSFNDQSAELTPSPGDRETAAHLGRRVAGVAKRLAAAAT